MATNIKLNNTNHKLQDLFDDLSDDVETVEEFKNKNFTINQENYDPKSIFASFCGLPSQIAEQKNTNNSLKPENLDLDKSYLKKQIARLEKEIQKTKNAVQDFTKKEMIQLSKDRVQHNNENKKHLKELEEELNELKGKYKEAVSYDNQQNKITSTQMKMMINTFVQKTLIAERNGDSETTKRIAEQVSKAITGHTDRQVFFDELNNESKRKGIHVNISTFDHIIPQAAHTPIKLI